MAADLSGVEAKLAQAERHKRAFEDALQGVHKEAGKTLCLVEDVNTGDYGLILPTVPPVPESARAILGDAIQNYRHVLDHLAYQLVLHPAHDGGRKVGKSVIQFPISCSETNYSDGCIAGADPGALAVIKALQPFGDKTHRLWLLHRLSIIDKHRLLLVLFHEVSLGLFKPEQYRNIWLRPPGPPAEHDTQLARLTFPPGQEADMDVESYLIFGSRFGDGPAKGIPLRGFLDGIERTVRITVARLTPFLAL